ncbi:MAG: hypothetical protein PCFJNLEI_00008 [Verrucomicrobiae bacterium]|nr:hypothetical protein [Verrucomicrobiae bacterium]
MQTKTSSRKGNDRASALAATLILLTIASVGIGATLLTMGTYGQANRTNYSYERAAQLADAAIAAAMMELNAGGDGIITTNESSEFITLTNRFQSAKWSFQTTVVNLNATNKLITATGYFDGVRASASIQSVYHTTSDTIHSLYAAALYAGNSSGATNYTLQLGGTGTGADFVLGDVFVNGNIAITGGARLRHPEIFTDSNTNGWWNEGEPYQEAGISQTFTNPVTSTAFNTYRSSTNGVVTYGNGRFDMGEAFVDSIGNGTYDSSENYTDLNGDGVFTFGEPFVDANGDGVFNPGESFVDKGNGVWNTGEQWTEDTSRSQRINGRYDSAGGYWRLSGGSWSWRTSYTSGGRSYSCSSWPAELFSDEGNGTWDTGEVYTDLNDKYDVGETFIDDRNGIYDYGAQATGSISGMPAPGVGQRVANGGDPAITPPDLEHMYYHLPKSGLAPADALARWGHDINVAANTFNSSGKITSQSNPSHIFVKNPTDRSYTKIAGKNDYFLEDPTDSAYSSSSSRITISPTGNNKVYFVDGNLWLHSPNALNFRFRNPGIKITIVARGNITLSDEFYYNGGTTNPLDSVALIAIKDPAQTNSGNIFLGDAQFGTGGEIHAMLYAENNFKDNNLNTADQPYLSVFGTMSAGNQVLLNRNGTYRTRLDIRLDERIRSGIDVPPGLPPAWANQRAIYIYKGYNPVSGSYASYSRLQ